MTPLFKKILTYTAAVLIGAALMFGMLQLPSCGTPAWEKCAKSCSDSINKINNNPGKTYTVTQNLYVTYVSGGSSTHQTANFTTRTGNYDAAELISDLDSMRGFCTGWAGSVIQTNGRATLAGEDFDYHYS
jgi:hypothetical protein